MTEIRITPADVDAKGKQFEGKRGELENLTQQANSYINSLKGVFTGQRANSIYNEWDSLQGNLKTAAQTLQQAADLLKRAASDFSGVDNQR